MYLPFGTIGVPPCLRGRPWARMIPPSKTRAGEPAKSKAVCFLPQETHQRAKRTA